MYSSLWVVQCLKCRSGVLVRSGSTTRNHGCPSYPVCQFHGHFVGRLHWGEQLPPQVVVLDSIKKINNCITILSLAQPILILTHLYCILTDSRCIVTSLSSHMVSENMRFNERIQIKHIKTLVYSVLFLYCFCKLPDWPLISVWRVRVPQCRSHDSSVTDYCNVIRSLMKCKGDDSGHKLFRSILEHSKQNRDVSVTPEGSPSSQPETQWVKENNSKKMNSSHVGQEMPMNK